MEQQSGRGICACESPSAILARAGQGRVHPQRGHKLVRVHVGVLRGVDDAEHLHDVGLLLGTAQTGTHLITRTKLADILDTARAITDAVVQGQL
jgi:hypothetical protein